MKMKITGPDSSDLMTDPSNGLRNAAQDDPAVIHPRAIRPGGGPGHAGDFGPIMHELGACSWSGTVTPLRAHVRPPVPNQLAEFERGGADWFENVFPQDIEHVRKNIAGTIPGKPPPAIEYRMVTEKASIVWVRHWWTMDGRAGRSRPGSRMDGFVQVIDERKSLEAECIRVCERERHEIGQELHDDVCQILAGLACMLEIFGRKVRTAIPHLTPTVDEMVGELNGGMVRARSLAHGLVPLRLVGLGLPAALAELAAQTRARRGVAVRTHFSCDLPPSQTEQAIQLYRIAQEAVSNSVKHGRATRIELSLRRRIGGVSLSIRDNGCGLPPASARTEGLGLQIMRYRAVAIGADFLISPGSDGGTTITVNCPRAVLRAGGRSRGR
jgi:signal transduction histidine kinase